MYHCVTSHISIKNEEMYLAFWFLNKKIVSLLTSFQGAKPYGTKFNGNEVFH